MGKARDLTAGGIRFAGEVIRNHAAELQRYLRRRIGNEHEKFSQRLANAMRQAGYEARPSVLFRLFNAHYRGRSVSVQTTSRWLSGQAIPAQDKL